MKVIIDTDPGVDDFIAISLALKSNKFDVLGLTTVEGNCSLENATLNAFKALDMVNRQDIEVYKGLRQDNMDNSHAIDVHGNNGLGGIEYTPINREANSEGAIDYLIRMVNTYPKQITILALGPLTNIAECVKKDKCFSKNVKSLLIMGGSASKGNITPYAEFNFYKDPVSAEKVLQADFENIIIFGWDVTNKMPLLNNYEEKLKKANGILPKFIYDITRSMALHDRLEYGGAIISDPILVAYLIDNEVAKLKPIEINIITTGEEMGRSIVSVVNESNIWMATYADQQKFYSILLDNIV